MAQKNPRATDAEHYVGLSDLFIVTLQEIAIPLCLCIRHHIIKAECLSQITIAISKSYARLNIKFIISY